MGSSRSVEALEAALQFEADNADRYRAERDAMWEQCERLRTALKFIKAYPNGVGSHAPHVVAAVALTTTALDTLAVLLPAACPPQQRGEK